MDADAIIVGAGAAGLAAARDLAARAAKVVVLEARDRMGGRVFSRPTARAAVPIELGAEFIHGPAVETQALLRDAGSAAIDTADESWVRGDDGALHRDDTAFAAAAGIFDEARSLDVDESVAQYLLRFASDANMRETVRAARQFVEGFDAADPARASVQAIGDELRSGVDWTSARPLGGYPVIFDRLARACSALGVQIYLSRVVRRISWSPGSVAVEVVASSGTQTFRARTAVVTVPAGVLAYRAGEAEIAFAPGLPAVNLDALRAIEMGHVVKIALTFTSAFWEHLEGGRYQASGFFRGDGRPFGVFWTQYPVRSEQVVAWVGGPSAQALSGTSGGELIAQALESFGALLGVPGVARDAFVSGEMHDWARDPFARGAYSYVAVGGGDARARLATPVEGTLFFAGEAMALDGQGGTVNGALRSGMRAAHEAAAVLGALR